MKRHETKKAHRKTAPKRKTARGSRSLSKTTKTKKRKTQKNCTKKALSGWPIKYDDVGEHSISDGGRLKRHHSQMATTFLEMRKGPALPKSFRFWDHLDGMNRFNLTGWEFGSWVEQEDRYNYVCAANLALYDLATIIGIRQKDIGLSKIHIAIGARGRGKALAHFEPWSFAINITRFNRASRMPAEKASRFRLSGGVGAFAHEYGHALDYFFGTFVDQDSSSLSLSGGISIRMRSDEALMKTKSMRGAMERVIHAIQYEKSGKKTPFYESMRAKFAAKKIPNYWLQRTELFARAFEQYVQATGKQKKITNSFLNQNKYRDNDKAAGSANWMYMPPSHLKRVMPHMKELLSMMATWLRKNNS